MTLGAGEAVVVTAARMQATSVTLYALYGKRVDRFVDNPDL